MNRPRPIDLMRAQTFRLLARREGIKARLAHLQRRINRECGRLDITETEAKAEAARLRKSSHP